MDTIIFIQNILLQDNTYTPPELPPSFRMKLEPIAGIPSDDEIKSVRSAVRSCEHLANSMCFHFPHLVPGTIELIKVLVPEMFDADTDMNLSQHLFDIQMGA